MVRRNGRTEVEQEQLDVDHELPAAERDEAEIPSSAAPAQSSPEGSGDVAKLRAERDQLLDRLARLQAEFENARKRSAREQQEFREYALTDAIKVLLPIMDSFERALHIGKGDKSELRGGVELIYKQLQDALTKLGVRPIEAKGELFDPRFHEAIEMVETTGSKDQQVLEELQRGYKLKDRLLRPAMVKVARNPEH